MSEIKVILAYWYNSEHWKIKIIYFINLFHLATWCLLSPKILNPTVFILTCINIHIDRRKHVVC